MTIVLNTAATGSPLGVKLMIGFEAIVDPKGLEMPNTMLMSPIAFDSDALDQSYTGVARSPTGTGGTKLVQVGKYSFKTTEDETEDVVDTSDSQAEQATEKEPTEKEPIIGLYIGGAIGVLLIVGLITHKVSKKPKSKNDNEEKKEQPGVQ